MDTELKLKKKYMEALKRIYDDTLFLAPYKTIGDVVLDVHEMLIKRHGSNDLTKFEDMLRRNK